MAKKKYYAVKKGKTPGIYKTWDECKSQVDGFPGAKYKGFVTQNEAETYLGIVEKPIQTATNMKDTLIAYVDGSYNDETKEFSYGMVILSEGNEEYFSERIEDVALADMRNVAGEIKGAEAAMRYAVDNQNKKLLIYHDYEGIEKWCTEEWKAKKEGTKAYQEYYKSISSEIDIEFVKVASHSNDKYNDIADELAKKAIFEIENSKKSEDEGKNIVGAQNLYITRELKELKNILSVEGEKIWASFLTKNLEKKGNQWRFAFQAEGKDGIIDIYQKGDGSTTFRPTGKNIEYAEKLKSVVEQHGMKNTSENKNYTIFLGEELLSDVVEYLKQLSQTKKTENDNGDRMIYQFAGRIGDKLTLTVFKDYKVGVQGKPLYLYNEFVSFISLASSISVNDVVDITNAFNDTEVEVSDARAKMSELLPNAYNSGKIDETIWKLFSPSVILIEDDKVLDDYSCWVFPVLRALEGYLKFLLGEKNIIVDKRHNFASVFRQAVQGDEKSDYVLLAKHKATIKSTSYEEVLETIYNYFRRNRHTIFHVEQVVVATRLIEEKQEARDIFYDVSKLIEDTYCKAEREL